MLRSHEIPGYQGGVGHPILSLRTRYFEVVQAVALSDGADGRAGEAAGCVARPPRPRLPLHFPPWIQMHPHQFSVTWGVPWDADLVILSIALVKTSLFTTLNYQFPFWETLSHDGVRRRLEASSTHSRSGIASASHNIALQGKASCAAAQRLSEEPRIMQ